MDSCLSKPGAKLFPQSFSTLYWQCTPLLADGSVKLYFFLWWGRDQLFIRLSFSRFHIFYSFLKPWRQGILARYRQERFKYLHVMPGENRISAAIHPNYSKSAASSKALIRHGIDTNPRVLAMLGIYCFIYRAEINTFRCHWTMKLWRLSTNAYILQGGSSLNSVFP